MIRQYILVFCVFLTFLIGCSGKKSVQQQPSDLQPPDIFTEQRYVLVWQDDFVKDGIPDPEKWTYDVGDHNGDGWGNNEAEFYTDGRFENVHIDNGTLKIIAQRENYGSRHYTSTRLVSKQDFTYGYFEIKARLPSGVGSWPAIWMLPTDYVYGPWPSSGEIDIMEQVGKNLGTVVGSIHTESYNHKIKTQKNAQILVKDTDKNFYRYGLKWTAERIEMYVDDVKYFTFNNEHTGYKTWPFDRPFHFLFNIAVGGTWGGPIIDDTAFPMTMEIEYVRVYKFENDK